MSGLNIITNRVIFYPHEINLMEWKETILLIPESKWWLQGNWEWKNDYLIIKFGTGRMGHDWHSLGLMVDLCIRPLMMCAKSHTFDTTGDLDGRLPLVSRTVEFMEGIWK